jgi:hypothetical protein
MQRSSRSPYYKWVWGGGYRCMRGYLWQYLSTPSLFTLLIDTSDPASSEAFYDIFIFFCLFGIFGDLHDSQIAHILGWLRSVFRIDLSPLRSESFRIVVPVQYSTLVAKGQHPQYPAVGAPRTNRNGRPHPTGTWPPLTPPWTISGPATGIVGVVGYQPQPTYRPVKTESECPTLTLSHNKTSQRLMVQWLTAHGPKRRKIYTVEFAPNVEFTPYRPKRRFFMSLPLTKGRTNGESRAYFTQRKKRRRPLESTA